MSKIYNNFSDKHGNEYGFKNYLDFASFWFDLPRKYAMANFPLFNKLQKCASSSKEARTPRY